MSLRNLFCVVSAIAFAVFAVPGAAAPAKQYSIQVKSFPEETSPGSGVTAVPVRVEVNIKNMSPPSTANSNISSFKFKLAGVTVATDSAHAPICPDALCSVTTDGVEVTKISPPIQAPSPAKPYYTVTFYVASCGDITVIDPDSIPPTQGAAVYGGSQFTGSKFNFKFDSSLPTSTASQITCGDLACVSTPFTVPGSNPAVMGYRGVYDKDGVCGASDTTPYYVTNELNSAAQILHFRWPNQAPADPGFFAAFKYTIAGISAASNPQVSWLPTTGSPEFITAPACLSNNLPAPYASLNADLTSNANKLKVTLSQGVTYAPLVASLPFPIVLGVERLQVTAINTSSGQWTVDRGTGGTNRSQHFAGDLVMSTPLPILPGTDLFGAPLPSVNGTANYTNGKHAQMCIFQDSGVLWFIDIGDGYIKPSN